MQKESVELNLGFKGDRTYIQGGDFYNAIDRQIREADDTGYLSQLVFRQFAKRECDLVWQEPGPDAKIVAQGQAIISGERHTFWIVESTRDVVSRRPFDEDRIVKSADVDGRRITLRGRSKFTPIEEIIALTKRLAYELTPDVDGKWVFGQLDLQRAIPDDYRKLGILQKSLIGGRFSLNEITVDDVSIGNIRFITGVP